MDGVLSDFNKRYKEVFKQNAASSRERGEKHDDFTANIVPGRHLKANYAKSDVILIDDTTDVIDDFNMAGGIGILHKDTAKTIKTVQSILDDTYIQVYNESCGQDAHTL